MRTETQGDKRHRLVFASFHDYLTWSESQPDNRSDKMRGQAKFYGATSMAAVFKMGHTGLPAEGIEGLALAEQNVQQMDRDLVSQTFQSVYSVEGADVDVARYLAGEPENMISYYMDDTASVQRVVTLVISIGVHCGISAKAIKEHGQRLMALVEAIERTGLQAEMWADMTLCEKSSGGGQSTGMSARQSIRLKAPGEVFDAGMFMFALTHASMLRGLGFNAAHAHPAEFRSAIGIGSYYGYPAKTLIHGDDYPDGAIYIPAIWSDKEAGVSVEDTLKQLGLLA